MLWGVPGAVVVTRAEADVLVQEYDDAIIERYTRIRWDSRAAMDAQFLRMNACRERLIDRLCGEEPTQPLPGRVP